MKSGNLVHVNVIKRENIFGVSGTLMPFLSLKNPLIDAWWVLFL